MIQHRQSLNSRYGTIREGRLEIQKAPIIIIEISRIQWYAVGTCSLTLLHLEPKKVRPYYLGKYF